MFVGEQGATSNHHLLLPEQATDFQWREGTYSLEIYAHLISGSRSVMLRQLDIVLSTAEAGALAGSDHGLFFDWSPELRKYAQHTRPALQPAPDAAV